MNVLLRRKRVCPIVGQTACGAATMRSSAQLLTQEELARE